MSGIESLVTQVHQGESVPRGPAQQQQQQQQQPQQQQQQQPQQQQQKPQEESFWSRVFCCGSKPKQTTPDSSRPLVANQASSSTNDINNTHGQQQDNQHQQNTPPKPLAVNDDDDDEDRGQQQSPRHEGRSVNANQQQPQHLSLDNQQQQQHQQQQQQQMTDKHPTSYHPPRPLNGHTNGYTQYVYNNYNPQTNEFDFGEGYQQYLMAPLPPLGKHKKTLVLDLDETLVHSSFKRIDDADFQIEIELDGVYHQVYVRKRPFVDEFLRHVAKDWEIVIFTASLAKYADPLLDTLDVDKLIAKRLFRESCVHHYKTYYVKDLRRLGRPISDSTIIDNSPFSYMFQPEQGVPIISWYDDRTDTQLRDILPFLDMLARSRDIREAMHMSSHLFQDGGIVSQYNLPAGITMMREDECWNQDDDNMLQEYYQNKDLKNPIAYGTWMPHLVTNTGMMMNIVDDDDNTNNNHHTPHVNMTNGGDRSNFNSPASPARSIGQQ